MSKGDDRDTERNETPAERLDRNLGELVQELRVAQMGVQFLFAALLAIPFQARFEKLTDWQRDVYAVTLVLTLVAAILLVAPASFHRVVFRRGLKRELVEASNRLLQLGLIALAAAMLSAMALVLDVVTGKEALFYVVLALSALAFAGIWWAWPTWVRASAGREDR